MKRIILKRKTYAKKVKDLTDFGIIRTVDRTQEMHKYKFDVDVRKPSAPRGRRDWIYWGSHNSIEKCRKAIQEDVKFYLGSDGEARIVDNKTGLVLEYWK
jgi:hypothetical protein